MCLLFGFCSKPPQSCQGKHTAQYIILQYNPLKTFQQRPSGWGRTFSLQEQKEFWRMTGPDGIHS